MKPGLKKVATLCVLKSEGRLLLLKRKNPPNQGMFTPVGGKLEAHEAPLQAALRETFEETGIRVTHMQFGGILTETSPTKYNWINYVYQAEIPFQPAPPCNEGELCWIEPDQLDQIPTPPTDLAIYRFLGQDQPFVIDAMYDQTLVLQVMRGEISGMDLLSSAI